MFTYDQLRDAVQAEIELEGEGYVYESFTGCDYVRDNKPSCLIGRAMHRLGVSVDALKSWDDGQDGKENTSIDNIIAFGQVSMTNDAAAFAVAVQSNQDTGQPWGRAYQEGIDAVDRLH